MGPLVLAALVLGACQGTSSPPEANVPAPAVDTLRYEVARFHRTYGDCNEEDEGCAEVAFSYPAFAEAPGVAVDSLNDIARRYLLAPVYDGGRAARVEALADRFGQAYLAYHEDAPDALPGWSLERTVEVPYNRNGLVTLAFHEATYTGGAHPNASLRFVNVEAGTGRRLGLEALLQPGARDTLRALVERRLKARHGLAPGGSLAAAGYFVEEGEPFPLADNVAFSGDGLRFVYNPYEIGPYAMGPVEVVLPYADLEGLLRPAILQRLQSGPPAPDDGA